MRFTINVSCIIHEILHPIIQSGARAGRYNTSDQLYAEYFSSLPIKIKPKYLENLREVRSSKRSFKAVKFSAKRFKGLQSDAGSSAKCYNCKAILQMFAQSPK